MEAKRYEKFILFSLFLTFLLIFLSLNAIAGDIITPTGDQLEAFMNLYTGNTQWPVWRVEDGAIQVDGKLHEEAWEIAQRIYITGEWMWNSEYNVYRADEMYTGLGDFIAVWRVLYDNQNIYVSCEFFDDMHSEGDGKEPWYYNDAVDMVFIPPVPQIPLYDPGGASPYLLYHVTRIWKRFTQTPGLIGIRNGVRYPGPINEVGWLETEPEGSLNLGGIYTVASPIDHPVVSKEYPGAWAMEIKIPYKEYTGSMQLPPEQLGIKFKMNLTICDDDDAEKRGYYDHTFLSVPMHRYHQWWVNGYKGDTTAYLNYAPTFIFAGYKENPISDAYVHPDEYNIYCGKTAEYYEEWTLDLYDYTNTGAIAEINGLVSNNNIFVWPNPIASMANIHFSLSHSSRASIRIYDVRGTLIRDFGRQNYVGAKNKVSWDLRDNRAKHVIPGNYVIRLSSDNFTVHKKVTVMK